MPALAGQKFRATLLGILANIDVAPFVGTVTLSTTSTTYVDITGASKNFTKIGGVADSDLVVTVSASCYVSVASTGVKVGLNINASDVDATTMVINPTLTHSPLPTGAVRISGLPAGPYTLKLRALRSSGTGTITMDSGDTATMIIQEKLL